jgi:acyl carrier protein
MYLKLIKQTVIFSIVKVKPEFNYDDIDDEDTLDDDLGFDSLDAVDLACEIETRLSISIPDAMVDVIKKSSVRDVCDVVAKIHLA